MPQEIYCDMQDCTAADGLPTRADWLVSNQDQGETLAWCNAHYLELCRAIVAQADGVTPPAAQPPDEPDPDDDDQGAIDQATARLEAPGRPLPAESGQESPGPDQPAAAPPGAAEPAPDGPRVVRRGTSRSRKAHEARKRSKAAAAVEPAPADEATA